MKKKFVNFLEKLSREEMRTVTGGYDDDGFNDGCTYQYMGNDPYYGKTYLEVETGRILSIIGTQIGQMPYTGSC
ncbi:hypothetical protein PZB74_12430 [Porifericola rhodea]|uniref:hypothetical protein n=1 Tax=Porifericola rhodea TaxID=930972 RepID=UPI00266501EC|nr:hypothetical protein [Porifericola rhodea]WKN29773.1 hypothetical protein PZB74_12430 [Porifericola rhodea]